MNWLCIANRKADSHLVSLPTLRAPPERVLLHFLICIVLQLIYVLCCCYVVNLNCI